MREDAGAADIVGWPAKVRDGVGHARQGRYEQVPVYYERPFFSLCVRRLPLNNKR